VGIQKGPCRDPGNGLHGRPPLATLRSFPGPPPQRGRRAAASVVVPTPPRRRGYRAAARASVLNATSVSYNDPFHDYIQP